MSIRALTAEELFLVGGGEDTWHDLNVSVGTGGVTVSGSADAFIDAYWAIEEQTSYFIEWCAGWYSDISSQVQSWYYNYFGC